MDIVCVHGHKLSGSQTSLQWTQTKNLAFGSLSNNHYSNIKPHFPILVRSLHWPACNLSLSLLSFTMFSVSAEPPESHVNWGLLWLSVHQPNIERSLCSLPPSSTELYVNTNQKDHNSFACFYSGLSLLWMGRGVPAWQRTWAEYLNTCQVYGNITILFREVHIDFG